MGSFEKTYRTRCSKSVLPYRMYLVSTSLTESQGKAKEVEGLSMTNKKANRNIPMGLLLKQKNTLKDSVLPVYMQYSRFNMTPYKHLTAKGPAMYCWVCTLL